MTEVNTETESAPVNVTAFWRAREDLKSLQPPPPATMPPALERLGPSPFPKSKFPFLGFLATIYDHVAACMDQKRGRP